MISLIDSAPTHYRRGRLKQLQTTSSEMGIPLLLSKFAA
jgi:hypothetical protein